MSSHGDMEVLSRAHTEASIEKMRISGFDDTRCGYVGGYSGEALIIALDNMLGKRCTKECGTGKSLLPPKTSKYQKRCCNNVVHFDTKEVPRYVVEVTSDECGLPI